MGYVHGRNRARRWVSVECGGYTAPALARRARDSARNAERAIHEQATGMLTAGRYELILAGIHHAAVAAAFPEAEVSQDGRRCRLFGTFDDECLPAILDRVAQLGGRVVGILSVDRLRMPVGS
jgi:hypothetical protein